VLSALPSTRPLGDLATTRSGPSFPASAVTAEPQDGATPVLGIANTKSNGSIDVAEIAYVSGLPESTGRIDESSLVLIRTNGNRQRIGNVYLPPVETHGMAVSAFQFLARAHDPGDREFLYWVLQGAGMQQRMSDAASGTTGLGNLAVKWLNAQRVPWADDVALRNDTVARIRKVKAAVTACNAELAALDALRSSLLADIFGGAA
jgi:type I restriction enzyme S subunit